MRMPFQTAAVAHQPGRFALESTQASPSLSVSLVAGETIAFTTADKPVDVDVRSGSIWLTQDAADQVVHAGQTFACTPAKRVVISAFAEARLDVTVRQ